MLKNLLCENVKVNQGAYFIGAATLFFAGPNGFEHGSKVGPIPLILLTIQECPEGVIKSRKQKRTAKVYIKRNII